MLNDNEANQVAANKESDECDSDAKIMFHRLFLNC